MRLILLLALSACAVQKESESHTDFSQHFQTAGHAEIHGQETVFRKTIRVAEKYRPDGGVEARIVTDSSTGTDRSFMGSSEGTTGAETQVATEAKAEVKRRFGLDLWPYLLGAGVLIAVGFVLWKLRPPWLAFLFPRKAS